MKTYRCQVRDDVKEGENVRCVFPVNLYDCEIGSDTFIGPFTEIQEGVVIGERCKISSHSFICSGVRIENEVFVGHGVMFINDRLPRSCNPNGSLEGADDWTCEETVVKKGASIGSNATILCGITIGEGALIGAGAVVTKDVPAGEIWVGNPAHKLS